MNESRSAPLTRTRSPNTAAVRSDSPATTTLYTSAICCSTTSSLSKLSGRASLEAAARAVRDVASQRWLLTESTYERENPKRIYYLSTECLLGPFAGEVAAQEKLDPLSLIGGSRT